MDMNIILENKNLIYSIANIYKGYASLEDLFQAGCIGIIEAYKKYDKTKNTKFSTFAYPYILGEISTFVRQDKPIKISKDISSLSFKIEKVKNMLAQELGRFPTNQEVADYLNVDINIYNDAINSVGCVDSLDYQITTDGNIDLYDVIGNQIDLDTIVMLNNELSKLDPLDREIILSHYLYDLTQMEIANKIGLNQVAVSRREQKVISLLRSNMS